jgi:hypothetical protein
MKLAYARKQIAEQARLNRQNENGGGRFVMNEAQKELQAIQKRPIHTQTVIRVQLSMPLASPSSDKAASTTTSSSWFGLGGYDDSDTTVEDPRVVFKGTFSPLDTVADLYKWVKSLLHPTNVIAAGLPFYLYSTPPPQQCGYSIDSENDTRTLQEVNLVPSKLLHLTFGLGLGKGKLEPGMAHTNGAVVPSTIEDMLSPTEGLEKGNALLSFAKRNPKVAVNKDLDSLAAAFISSLSAAEALPAPAPSSSSSSSSSRSYTKVEPAVQLPPAATIGAAAASSDDHTSSWRQWLPFSH